MIIEIGDVKERGLMVSGVQRGVGQTRRRPRLSKTGGIQREKLQNLKCWNWMIFPIVRLLAHVAWS